MAELDGDLVRDLFIKGDEAAKAVQDQARALVLKFYPEVSKGQLQEEDFGMGDGFTFNWVVRQ